MYSQADPTHRHAVRPASERRKPPDRGIVLLEAKDRIGPRIWALHGKVERPVVLRDDYYVDNTDNDFYRDHNGHAFLLLPYVAPDAEDRFAVADAAYRRAVALGVTERPEIFFTCVYLFQLPEYRCIHIHADREEDILSEAKCLQLMHFEKLRMLDELGRVRFGVRDGRKVMPVECHCERPDAGPSTNLTFALNSLVLHHAYSAGQLQAAWDSP